MNKSNNNFNNNVQKNASNNPQNILLTIVIVVVLVFVGIRVGVQAYHLAESRGSDNKLSEDKNNQEENDDIEAPGSVNGQYLRNAFSGNTFEYNTGYETATFIFNKNGTFEVNYSEGNKYKGIYELYNGLYIANKVIAIKNDQSISNREQLITNINNVTNKMMDSIDGMLNTYLIWLKINDDIIQPFVIRYNLDTSTGTAVSILTQVQGSFNLK